MQLYRFSYRFTNKMKTQFFSRYFTFLSLIFQCVKDNFYKINFEVSFKKEHIYSNLLNTDINSIQFQQSFFNRYINH